MSQTEPCIHYDIIGPHPLFPDQPKDMATCKFCRRQRQYKLVFVDKGYEDLRVQRPGYLASKREIVGYMGESRKGAL